MSEHLSSKKDEFRRYDIVSLKNDALHHCLKKGKKYIIEDILVSKEKVEYLVELFDSNSDLIECNEITPAQYVVSKEKIEKVEPFLSDSSDEE